MIIFNESEILRKISTKYVKTLKMFVKHHIYIVKKFNETINNIDNGIILCFI